MQRVELLADGQKLGKVSSIKKVKKARNLSAVFFWLFVVELPALGFFHIFDFTLHILENLILQWFQFSIPPEHPLITGEQHIKTD